jgi:hypothetical protein
MIPTPARPTYDAKQLGAVLIVCARCGRAFYMTLPARFCILCRRIAAAPDAP